LFGRKVEVREVLIVFHTDRIQYFSIDTVKPVLNGIFKEDTNVKMVSAHTRSFVQAEIAFFHLSSHSCSTAQSVASSLVSLSIWDWGLDYMDEQI